MTSNRQIFLSHSGHDSSQAIKLAAMLQNRLANCGCRVEVFNTSEPEHRYADLEELISAGEDWRARADRYEGELRAYLTENLRASAAFVLLVTPNSLAAASKVIEYEIAIAREVARQDRRLFFFPCVTDGAELFQLPDGAIEFQGINLAEEEGNQELLSALRHALSEDR